MTGPAWHWAEIEGGKPVLLDGRELVVGEWLRHEGEIRMCERGLHASRSPLQALRYAPGPFDSQRLEEMLIAGRPQ